MLKKAFEWKFDYYSLKDVCLKIQDGSHFSPKEQSPIKGDEMYPYVTSKNIRNNCLDLSNITYVNKKFHKLIYQRCDPKYGDVLLTKDGVNTGNVTINTLKEPFSMLSSVCLIRPEKEILSPMFIKYYLQSPEGFNGITGKMSGTAIKRIILKNIKNARIPVPPIEKQIQIVQEIETRFSVCDQLEATIKDALEKAETLRQSVLKHAFDGKLLSETELEATRQEPDWEPAETLLERIRKEKAALK